MGRLSGKKREGRLFAGGFRLCPAQKCRCGRSKRACAALRAPKTALFCSLCAEISILFRKNTWQMLHKYDIITTNSVGEAMRIIAGEAKGRKLYAPGGEDTRPTADRIRESVFGILGASRAGGARAGPLWRHGRAGAGGAQPGRGSARRSWTAASRPSPASAATPRPCWARNARARRDHPRRLPQGHRAPDGSVRPRVPRPALPHGSGLWRRADAPARWRAAGRRGAGDPRTGRARAISLPAGFSLRDARRYGETCVEFVVEGEEA